jgi:U3 small nucleolar RNA-associated protein 11
MVSGQIKNGEHYTVVKKTPESEKIRKLEENHDIALVGLKRMIEKNKADKIQSNLHLLDFPKQNNHIHFVSDPNELKKSSFKRVEQDLAEEIEEGEDGTDINEATEQEPSSKLYLGEKEKYVKQLKRNLSENKSQYKKLADAIIKEQQLTHVESALSLEKQLKGKGKKRKFEDQATGKVSYKWFAERKR